MKKFTGYEKVAVIDRDGKQIRGVEQTKMMKVIIMFSNIGAKEHMKESM